MDTDNAGQGPLTAVMDVDDPPLPETSSHVTPPAEHVQHPPAAGVSTNGGESTNPEPILQDDKAVSDNASDRPLDPAEVVPMDVTENAGMEQVQGYAPSGEPALNEPAFHREPSPKREANMLVTQPLPDSASRPPSPVPPAPEPSAPSNLRLPPVSYIEAQTVDRPLNVTDALTYLDAVKIQFQDLPEVYNLFLDIMKDFKSQL